MADFSIFLQQLDLGQFVISITTETDEFKIIFRVLPFFHNSSMEFFLNLQTATDRYPIFRIETFDGHFKRVETMLLRNSIASFQYFENMHSYILNMYLHAIKNHDRLNCLIHKRILVRIMYSICMNISALVIQIYEN